MEQQQENKRKLVTVERIEEVKPIENADSIEAVQVRGWWVVTRKDEFKVGDKCIYFEIDSFLPITPEFEFLTKNGTRKMYVEEEVDGETKRETREGVRLRTIKLRGQVSQGLVMPLSILEGSVILEEGTDVSEELGVIKYEGEVPKGMAGIRKGNFPIFISKTDEDRIQNKKNYLTKYKDDTFTVTEKLDGTSSTFYRHEGQYGVCGRNWEIERVEGNLYWEMSKKYKLEDIIPEGFALQGEIVGEGIQGNKYKMTGNHLYIFSMFDIRKFEYLNHNDFIEFCIKNKIQTAPIVDVHKRLPDNIDDMVELADGKSMLNNQVNREGLVWRKITGDYLSFKVISNKFLLKYGE